MGWHGLLPISNRPREEIIFPYTYSLTVLTRGNYQLSIIHYPLSIIHYALMKLPNQIFISKSCQISHNFVPDATKADIGKTNLFLSK